ncbi:MAG: nucleoside hydrolase [Oscillospiraceae bacterium]
MCNLEKNISRLRRPTGMVDVVLDTDTYNEIDDQFALAYLLKSDDKLTTKAIYAAPFFNSHSVSPKDGMEKSYGEILNILELMDRRELTSSVYRGSETYLTNEETPVISPAAQDLARRAMEYSSEKPLYVVAIGAITNVASALLLQPEISEKIVVVWLGGNALHWTDNKEFNLMQDVAAARVIFGCGVPLVQLPCMGVVSAFATCGPELEFHLKGKNALSDYLVKNTTDEALRCGGGKTWSRIIWDVTAVGWLLGDDLMSARLEHTPVPEYDHRYAENPQGIFYQYVYHIHRDRLFADLFEKLTK